jgi:hypothetical protein
MPSLVSRVCFRQKLVSFDARLCSGIKPAIGKPLFKFFVQINKFINVQLVKERKTGS